MTLESGAKAVRERMRLPPRPSAIIAANHLMATGVLSAARDAGLRVPDDLSLVAFDSMRNDPLEAPALTSIEISIEDIVRATLLALRIGPIRKNSPASNPLEIFTKLVIRQSTNQMRTGAL